MSEATEGLIGIDALGAELAAKETELAQALFETEAQRQELAICNDQIAKMAAQIEELMLDKTRLEAELILMTAERDGALSMMQSVQADSIMAGKEIDFFRQDRDRWEKRFDSLLQIKVEAQMMQALQPMPSNPILDHLVGNMSEEQKKVLNGLLDKVDRHQPPREVPLKQAAPTQGGCTYPNCPCASEAYCTAVAKPY